MTDYVFTTLANEEIPIIIETRHGIHNITLRPKTVPHREIRISKPWITSTNTAIRFVEQKRVWVERIFACAPPKIHIKNGDILEFLGQKVLIRHDSNEKSNFYCADNLGAEKVMIIGGAPEMLESRVRDFIKKEFSAELKKLIKTAPPDFWPDRIAVRDTTSRWGSCSSTGTMSFSWRLAFAPYDVMRYVIMHELAHKKYMDHSPAFWRQVSELYGFGVERSKLWLAQHGANLHQYF